MIGQISYSVTNLFWILLCLFFVFTLYFFYSMGVYAGRTDAFLVCNAITRAFPNPTYDIICDERSGCGVLKWENGSNWNINLSTWWDSTYGRGS